MPRKFLLPCLLLAVLFSACATDSSTTIASSPAHSTAAGPVLTPQQALDDPQVAAMRFLHSIADYPGLRLPVPVSGLPVDLSATPGIYPARPPLLGEHTEAVLRELGYTAAQIAALKAEGIV